MFNEYTAIFLQDHDKWDAEVMFHINEKCKITSLYCWADNIPTRISYLDYPPYERYSKPKTSPCTNNLFVNLSVQWFIKSLNVLYINLNDEPLEEHPFLLKAIEKYKDLVVYD